VRLNVGRVGAGAFTVVMVINLTVFAVASAVALIEGRWARAGMRAVICCVYVGMIALLWRASKHRLLERSWYRRQPHPSDHLTP
jgi:hypothetical protein